MSNNTYFKYTLSSLFILLLHLSSFAQNTNHTKQVSQKNAFIGGVITEPVEDIIRLHLTENYITRKEKVYQIPLNKTGEFRFQFPVEKPTVVKVRHGDENIDIYLEPGDAVKISANGADLYDNVIFEGKAALHNEYLHGASEVFPGYSDSEINTALTEMSSLNFRKYMDKVRSKKHRFLENFLAEKEATFSEDFMNYAKASVDYWWAYNLMRYRTEYPAANSLSVPMTLSADYYDFLREIEISNDAALINQDYLYFLDVFLGFAQRNPPEWKEIKNGTDKLVVKNAAVLVIDDGAAVPLFMDLAKGKSLHIADSRLTADEDINADDFYRVEAHSGLTGWIGGSDIAYNNRKPQGNRNRELIETRKVERSFMEPYIVGSFESLEIREKPHLTDRVKGFLYRGEEAEFLLNQTGDKFTYRHFGTLYSDYWYQIRKKDGTEGWVFRGGVSMRERKITIQEVQEVDFDLNNDAAKANLHGRTLFFALAKDLYQRARTEKQAQLRTDVFNFMRINPIEDYDKTVQAAYENALRRHAGMQTTDFARQEVINVAPPPSAEDAVTVPQTNKKRSAKKAERAEDLAALPEIDNIGTVTTQVETKLQGKVHNIVRRKISIKLILDPVLYKEETREIEMKPDGSFAADFKLTHGVHGEVIYGKKMLEIFLEPGDDLHVAFDGSAPVESAIFSGTGKENNKYLKDTKVQFASQETEMKTKLRYAKPADFSTYLTAETHKRQQYLDRYLKKSKLSPEFTAIAQSDIVFWRASNLLNYPYEHPLYHDKPAPMQVPADYYAFLKEADVKEKGKLPGKHYVYFLQQYLDYLALQTDNIGKEYAEIARENLQGEAYYYTVAKLLNSACKRGNLAEAGTQIQKFIKDCPYEVYNNVLRFSYNDAKGLRVGAKAPDFELTDIDGKTVRLSDFKGKVVYIDFWATWCAPCRRYLPYSKKLEQEFDPEKVEFVYISLDENKETWEKYVKQNGLTGTQLCATSGHGYNAKIAELYKVKNLPSYFLVDAEGKIARSPASNPASSQVKEEIRELLREGL